MTLVPTIRSAEAADAPAFHDIFAAPATYAGTLQLPYPTAELWAKRLADLPAGGKQLVAALDGRVVGCLGVHRDQWSARRAHVAHLGIAVHADWQGRGIGTAQLRAGLDVADNWLGVLRLELAVYAHNAAAMRLYERHASSPRAACRAKRCAAAASSIRSRWPACARRYGRAKARAASRRATARRRQ